MSQRVAKVGMFIGMALILVGLLILRFWGYVIGTVLGIVGSYLFVSFLAELRRSRSG